MIHTICSVIDEVRKMHKHRDYSRLPACIEEIQGMADRMENALYGMKDMRLLKKRIKKGYRKLKVINKKLEESGSEVV